MAQNRGKQFEQKFKSDWVTTIGGFIHRLNDQISGYKNYSQNLCDFICYKYPTLFLLEAKSHLGNTFPLVNLTQYDKLLSKVGIPGVRTGVVLWMIEKDYVVYLPIDFIRYLKENNYKSFNVKMISDDNLKDKFLVLPSIKKRVFMDTDYSPLLNLPDNW